MTLPPLPPWSLLQPILLWLVLPAVIASAIVSATLRFWMEKNSGWLAWSVCLGLIAGLAVGNLTGGVPWKFGEDHFPLLPWWSAEPGWTALIPATFAVLLGSALSLGVERSSPLGGMFIRLATVAGGCWWLTSPNDRLLRSWLTAAGIPETSLPTEQSQGLYWQTGMLLFLVCLLNWEVLRRVWRVSATGKMNPQDASLSEESQSTSLPTASVACGSEFLLAALWCGPVSALIILSHSARFGNTAVLIAAGLMGLWLGRLLTFGKRAKPKAMPDGAAQRNSSRLSQVNGAAASFAAPAVAIPGLLLSAAQNSYSKVPLGAYLLVAAAPWALALLALPALSGRSPRVKAFMACLLLALPGIAAVIWGMNYEVFDFGESW